MSLNHISDTSKPAIYLNPNVGSLTLSGSNVAGYSPTNLNFYEEYTKDCEFIDSSGATLNDKFTIYIQRIGRFCQLHIYNKALFACPNSSLTLRLKNISDIPARFRPNSLIRQIIGNVIGTNNVNGFVEFDNGTVVPSLISISSQWQMNNYTGFGGPYPYSNIANNTFYGAVLNYYVE